MLFADILMITNNDDFIKKYLGFYSIFRKIFLALHRLNNYVLFNADVAQLVRAADL